MIGIEILNAATVLLTPSRAFPSNDISRCPAIILAVSRTHRVMGRITLLVSSINTMKFIRAKGVPCGRRCDSM